MISSSVLFSYLLLLNIHSPADSGRPRNIYHFTACSFVSTAVVFQVPGSKLQKQRETNITVRGEISNNSRLLIRKGDRNDLSLPLKKGAIDTTFNIQNRGEALSFYFLTDTPAGPGEQEKAANVGRSGQLSYVQEAASNAIGVFELIVRL